MQKLFSIRTLIYFLFFVSMTACKSDRLDVDVSNIDISMKLIRLDEAVFNEKWSRYGNEDLRLKESYGGYYSFYSEFILNNPHYLNDSLMQIAMSGFVNDPTMHQFYEEIVLQFGKEKFDPYMQELTDAFKHFSYYFPKEKVPNIVLYQSGFNYKIVPNDTLLGIGLEWYLGPDNELIKRLSNQAFPQFEKNKMRSDFLVVDAVKGFLKVKYQDYQQMDNLLSVMIFYGKIQYLTDAMLHQKSDAAKMNYTKEEWEWMENNEKQVWTYLAENNLLFDNNLRMITQWVNDGPFTTGLPQESPSRAGIYMGWKLVGQYMSKHPETSLAELIELKDYNRILSAYKPGK